jgi:hypothetical protein
MESMDVLCAMMARFKCVYEVERNETFASYFDLILDSMLLKLE